MLLLIFGQMLLFSSAALLAYGVAIWTAFHVFVVFFEEHRLQREFGDYELKEKIGRGGDLSEAPAALAILEAILERLQPALAVLTPSSEPQI